MRGRRAVLALGSNLGDRGDILQGGVDAIEGIEGVQVTAVSPVYETVPVGGPPQPDYLNAVALANITIPARELLDQLHEVEAVFDRVRLVRWGPRTLDIDIITVDGEHSDDPDLTLPHCYPPEGRPPVPPDVRAGGPDRKNRGSVRPARADGDTADLTLPHPRAHERAFVLVPWHDIDPDAVLPGYGPVADLLADIDASGIRRSEVSLVLPEAGS
jgi:2-amino-4-hydroxy-6-hydroxymethyldihydropteridine diphosphokinase